MLEVIYYNVIFDLISGACAQVCQKTPHCFNWSNYRRDYSCHYENRYAKNLYRICCICCIKLCEEMGVFVKRRLDKSLPIINQLLIYRRKIIVLLLPHPLLFWVKIWGVVSQNSEPLLVHPAWASLWEGLSVTQSPSPGGISGAERKMGQKCVFIQNLDGWKP